MRFHRITSGELILVAALLLFSGGCTPAVRYYSPGYYSPGAPDRTASIDQFANENPDPIGDVDKSMDVGGQVTDPITQSMNPGGDAMGAETQPAIPDAMNGLEGQSNPNDIKVANAEDTAPSNDSDPLDPSGSMKMPTQHSHWLVGRVFNARVTVYLNNVWAGEFTGPMDIDITMKLRAGSKTIRFEYEPTTATAEAEINVLESEWTPRHAPLVTFESSTEPTEETDKIPPKQSQSFDFIAQ